MKLPVLPPGTILQHLYLKERLYKIQPGHFLEVGCGKGFISNILLDLGWTGIGCDLNPDSLEHCSLLNHTAIESAKFSVLNQDFIALSTARLLPKFDLVISCMVIEHLNDVEENKYFQQVKEVLSPKGKIIILVPSCPDYWGCEDEIAGHYRRYTFQRIRNKLHGFNFVINDLAGLTYPVSNILFPMSEFLVARAESKFKSSTMLERTKNSGNRKVFLKTSFPLFLKFLLNDFTMYPFHLLQKYHKHNKKSLVIYAEATSK